MVPERSVILDNGINQALNSFSGQPIANTSVSTKQPSHSLQGIGVCQRNVANMGFKGIPALLSNDSRPSAFQCICHYALICVLTGKLFRKLEKMTYVRKLSAPL